jgi:hypothetical protein
VCLYTAGCQLPLGPLRPLCLGHRGSVAASVRDGRSHPSSAHPIIGFVLNRGK